MNNDPNKKPETGGTESVWSQPADEAGAGDADPFAIPDGGELTNAAAEDAAQETEIASPQEQEIAELKDRLLRAMAEAENIRRRADRDRQETAKFGVSNFARDLLEVADNLQRALESMTPAERETASDETKQVLTGVELTQRELLSVFKRHGIEPIDPRGEKFDPNFHQAIAEIPNAEIPAGHCVDVVQTGFIIHERLLRPAMVTVSKGAGAGGPTNAGGTVDESA